MVRITITNHAIERFMERIAPGPRREVYQLIEHMLAESIDLEGARLRQFRLRDFEAGHEFWQHTETGAIFVIQMEGETIVVKTVVTGDNPSKPAKGFRNGGATERAFGNRSRLGRLKPYVRQRQRYDADDCD